MRTDQLARACRPVVSLFSVFVLLLSSTVSDGQNSDRLSCTDPLSLQNLYMNNSWFTHYLHFKFGEVSQGYVSVQVPKKDFDELETYGVKGGVTETHVLSSSDAMTLRSHVKGIAGDPAIWETTKLSAFFISFLNLPGGAVAAEFWKYLAAEDRAIGVKANALAEVFEEGGSIERILTAGKRSTGEPFLVHSFAYRVQIMNHVREYVTTSCTYSVVLTISEIRTMASTNNKILKVVGDHWDVLDVEEGKHDEPLYETSRDTENLFLSKHEPGSTTNLQRISLKGGPWQFSRGNTWVTLYDKTMAY